MKIKFNTFICRLMVTSGIGMLCLPITGLTQSCPGLGSLTLTVVAAPTPTLSAPAQLCAGATGTVAVNQMFSSYAWSTGGNTQSISINGPGAYTVTVNNTAGCTGTATVNVAPTSASAPTISQNPYTCNGNLTLNAGAGFSMYVWSNGAGTQTTTVSTAGLYAVTVTNAQGCTGTSDISVSIPTPPVVNITGNLTICSGVNTTLSATTGFSNYVWSAGGNTSSISVSTSGTYTVTVTDAFGCTDTESATVTASPSPAPAVANASFCPGTSVTLNVSNAPFSSYAWSTGSNTSSTTVTTSGNYTVTVTAANGCTGTTTANAVFLATPNLTISSSPYACNGNITLNAGAGFSTYAWSNGAGTPTTTVSVAGLYTVTVTNAQGCTGTSDFNVSIPPPPAVSISGNTSFCEGSAASLSATAGFSNYAWSNGQNGPAISVTNGGAYVVTVTDAFGCTATNSFMVNKLLAPQPLVAGPASVCAGTTAIFNTTTTFPAYSWNTGQNTPSITVSTAGPYTVTVTAANGCTGTDTQVLSLLAAPTPNIAPAPYACNNQLILNAGAGFSNYAWSSGSSTQTLTVSTSGTYLVTVTNAQGCTGSDTYNAAIPAPPVVSISGNNSLCSGSNMTLIATAGFSGYAWSTGSSNPGISVSVAGNYTVTVTDAFGCTATNILSVSTLPSPAPVISGPAQICATGSATFSVPATFSAYTWSTGAATSSIVVSTAGIYTVTVTDANGCTGTDSQSLVVANSLQPQITALPYACNGQITLDAGAGFSTYTWSGGQSTPNITVTANGAYNVTVSDAGGCVGNATINVSIPQPPTVDITGNNNICAGTATTLSATAGLSAYVWSNGQVGASVSVTTAGTYGVTATDALGCTVTDNFTLTTSALPQPVITGPAVICINSSGTLALNGTFSQYSWSTGASTPSIAITTGNTYAVTVTDAQGCTGTDTQIVTVATGLSPTVVQLPYACNGAQTLDAGPGFATYLWSGGQNTATISVTSGGTYTITVTDATGCTGTSDLAITIPAMPQVTIAGQNSFCQNSQTTLAATPGFISYTWNTGATTDTLTVNMNGTFSVTATDNLGCTDTTSIIVTVLALPYPHINGLEAICAGRSDKFWLGPSFAAYAWSTGSTEASISTTTAGLYAVTVTDENGCTGTDDITLVIIPNPIVTLHEEPYTCDGQITLTATPGFLFYSWTAIGVIADNNNQITVNLSNLDSVIVGDINGCAASAVHNVTIPVVSQVILSGPSQFCTGSSMDLAASPGFTTYTWNNGLALPNIPITTSGAYSVTATDALGCTSTASLTVGNFPDPAPVIAGPQSVCPGSPATLSVGGNFTAYVWDNGASTANITLQPPFTATVTVTDFNGCTATATASVSVSNQLSPNIVQLPYACDGRITLDAGAGFPSYTWSNTGTTATIQVTQSGSYSVTVGDGNGCSGTATIQVNVPSVPVLNISGMPLICPGQSTTLTASSGFIDYQWSDGQSGAVISVDQTTNYLVTATDINGCSLTASFTLGLAPPLTPAISTLPYACNGQASLDAGTGFSSYTWNNGTNAQTVNVLQSGLYSVTVTDANGCSGTATIPVTIPVSIVPQVSSEPILCPGATITSSVINQQDYTQFLWNTGATTSSITGVQGGQNYAVTVTDINGCTQTAGFMVLPAPVPIPTVIQQPYVCNGQIVLDAGVGFASYAWSGPGGFSATNQQPTVSAAGLYTVTVTNSATCSGTASAQVAIPPDPVVSITGATSFCAGGSTTLVATAGFTAYTWSNGSNLPSLAVQAAGTYSVTVTNATGCTATATATAQANGLSPALQNNEVFCQGTTLTINVVGAYAGYMWSDGSGLSSLTVSQPGLYAVTVTDASGCTGVASSQILAVPPATVSIASAGIVCGANGVTLTTSGSVGTFAWSNGATGTPLLLSQPGTYTVTVTDPNGCTATDVATVPDGTPLSTTLQRQTCRLAAAGTQTLTLTAANGCDSIVTIITTYQPTKPGLALDLTPVIEAKPGQEIVLQITGNFLIDSVAFSSSVTLSCTNCTSPSLTATAPAIITVLAFDADGCGVTEQIQLRVSKQIDIYVPNVLQPGSIKNGYFGVSSSLEFTAVRNFNVFDRWGNALFHRDELPTNDPNAGWDGTFRNQVMQPGVYVYYFELLLADGSKKIYSGDVTILK